MIAPPTSERPPALVFDIGGTSLRAGLYDPAADRLIDSRRRAAPGFHRLGTRPVPEMAEALADAMAELGGELIGGQAARDVVVGFPGPVDAEGAVLAAPTLWGDRRVEPLRFADLLGPRWPEASIAVINDMSAAGLYYLREPREDFCVFTISSGIGHKVFIAGRPLVGAGGRGGEIGHLKVDFGAEAPCCECGGKGHLAALASGAAAAHAMGAVAAEAPESFRGSLLWEGCAGDVRRIDNQDLAEAFRLGDEWARRVGRRLAEPNGRALAAIHLATGVERFVILGGFARALGPPFCDLIAAAAADAGWALSGDWHKMIELGEAHDDAGLIGAGRYAGLAQGAR